MNKPKPLFGFDLLRQQAIMASIAAVDVIVQEAGAESELDTFFSQGDSEIERLFHNALVARIKFGLSHLHMPRMAPSADHAERGRTKRKEFHELIPIIERQVQIEEFRVDFLISVWTDGTVRGGMDGPSVGQPRWRKLVVECDGHEYHERTKEQAASDRSRDRKLTSLGFDVFRFTGSELWRDPWDCACQVHDWAEKGL